MEKYEAHPTAVIDEGCIIGKGTRIWHFCHLMSGCRIGEECNIGQNVVVSPGVVLGNRVKVQNNVSIYTGVICEDDVFLGPSCVFTNVINPRSFISRKAEFRTTRVEKGASIGANATLVCGNRKPDRAIRHGRRRERRHAGRPALRLGGRKPGKANRLGQRIWLPAPIRCERRGHLPRKR